MIAPTAMAAAFLLWSAATAVPEDEFRLPDYVVPVSYDLRVAADLAERAYSGRVEIVVRTSRSVCQVKLNAEGVRANRVLVTDRQRDLAVPVRDHRSSDADGRLTVDVAKCLTPGRDYVVTVEFDAPLRDDMSGFYSSSYTENGVTKWLAVTKFEPTYARRAFPCFDEPAMKAPFTVTIGRQANQISLSNMPLLNTTRDQHTKMYWDHFQQTPPISTYLVAFFVGEFYALKSHNIGVYTHRDYVNQTAYIAEESPKLLEAMENFTGVDYMMPKLDLLAIPDFAAGAMENWGLNTYRERLLLLSENSKTKTKEFVTTVVQHELSHQWFGDLVTCAWWDYLWLNEGFATFFEYFATKMVEPDWRLEDLFVIEVHQSALEADQTPMHAISGSVRTPPEIKGMFDEISYDKAGAVLRMLQYTVTEDLFKKALNLYLTNNVNTPVTPENLWIAFENALFDDDFVLAKNLTITEIMKSWTEQPGYPLVEISKVNNAFTITQERFLISASNETENNTQWCIGLTYTTKNEKDFSTSVPLIWLTENQTVLPIENEAEWYIFNLQSVGFYRVNYDYANWNALIDQLHADANAIHVLNRAQLIDDAFNLAKANRVPYALALNLTRYLVQEDDVIPWHTAKREFAFLMNRMRRCSHGYRDLKMYVSRLADIIHTKTQSLAESHDSADHNVLTGWNSFSNWACLLNNDYCIKSASRYFKKWLNGEKIPADIKDAAFCVGVRDGIANTWNRMLGVYNSSNSASERQSAQLALACSNDKAQLSKYLDFMFEGTRGPIRPQDHRVVYQSMASTSKGLSVLAEFLVDKLDRILNEIPNGEQIATSIYSVLASRMILKDEISKIDELRKSPKTPAHLQKKFNSSYDSVEKNLAWFKMYHREIGEWAANTVTVLKLNDSTTTSIPFFDESQTPRPSSATTNVQTYRFVLQCVSVILFVNAMHVFNLVN